MLGDTFLRSAYVVYHLGNNQISLAPTVFNATDSDIREIGNGTDGVPNATLVPGAVSTGAGRGGGARNDGLPDFNEEVDTEENGSDVSSSDESDLSDDDVEVGGIIGIDSAATRSAVSLAAALIGFAIAANVGVAYML